MGMRTEHSGAAKAKAGLSLASCGADAADELVLATDDSVFAAVDRLAAKKRVETDAVFRQREKVVGLNHTSLMASCWPQSCGGSLSQCHNTATTLSTLSS